jgi:hypothetical protein
MPLKVKDVFAESITRDIAPVVYFHEQSPEKVQQEVSEYIITGGFADNDPRRQRVSNGIHEQFVKLLKGIAGELNKSGGADLPAAWISGFYGSGKSSFAKLLGLALDGLTLPGGGQLAEALLARDESPKRAEFRQAWEELRGQIDPLAVVFDIGATARDEEYIHSVVKRQLQERLGYCTINHHVADYELRLEINGEWEAFLAKAEEVLDAPWEEARQGQLAEDEFSTVMHALKPNLYESTMDWIESRAGNRLEGTSPAEITQDIANMLRLRAPGKTLFIVVDEVSQHIHQKTNQMLKLQSFVSDLGQKLKGQVWLLATGQQALEDSEDDSEIGKLKDRFPPKLRVHLAPTNIRDVVHRRLLKKKPTAEKDLRDLFRQHRSELTLYAYNCDTITPEDFLEVYPLLPGYVDLLMQITTNLRMQSARVQGDDYAIRGLLQLLGEIFRQLELGEQDLGTLITMDNIYEVQNSALDADVQNTMARIVAHDQVMGDDMAVRVAKAIALLELIQEEKPTTAEFISQCLYHCLGAGNLQPQVEEALQKLRDLGLITYSDKTGYKIQSSAGQEWARDRDSYKVPKDQRSEVVADTLKLLVGGIDKRPAYKGMTFPWASYYSDGRHRNNQRLQVPNDLTVVTVDFRYLTNQAERDSTYWIQTSAQDNLKNSLIWVVGSPGELDNKARELVQSQVIVNRYRGRGASGLSREKQRQLFEEGERLRDHEKDIKTMVARAFEDGELYFRGRLIDKQEHGTSFTSRLKSVSEAILPDLYNLLVDIRVSPGELEQLLQPTLSGPSPKFMAGQLGILDLDASKYIPSCTGEVPTRLAETIADSEGISGAVLFNEFSGPPYGYAPDTVKACLVGLLRAEKLRIRTEQGTIITSVRDPGARDMFTRERDLRRADILPPGEIKISPRDRVNICRLFESFTDTRPDLENDVIADAVFQHFPNLVHRLQAIEWRYKKLPNNPEWPETLDNFRKALEKSTQSRATQDALVAVKRYLTALRDGIELLQRLEAELTENALTAVTRAVNVQQYQVAQLEQVGATGEVREAIDALKARLELDRPWREIASLEPHLTTIETHYHALRTELIDRHEKATEAIRQQIRQRSGFSELTTQQSDHVLRPVREAAQKYQASPDAFYPSLLELRDTAFLALDKAKEDSDINLDNTLAQLSDEQVIPVSLNLQGREVSSPEEVEALVSELRDLLLQQLQDRQNIRIRLT